METCGSINSNSGSTRSCSSSSWCSPMDDSDPAVLEETPPAPAPAPRERDPVVNELSKTRKDLAAAKKALKFFMEDHQRLRRELKHRDRVVRALERRTNTVVDHMVEQGDLIEFFVEETERTAVDQRALQEAQMALLDTRKELATVGAELDSILASNQVQQQRHHQTLTQLQQELTTTQQQLQTLRQTEAEKEQALQMQLTQAQQDIQRLQQETKLERQTVASLEEALAEANLEIQAAPRNSTEVRCLESALFKAEKAMDRLRRERDAIAQVAQDERHNLITKHNNKVQQLQATVADLQQQLHSLLRDQNSLENKHKIQQQQLERKLHNAEHALEAQKENSRVMKSVYERMLDEQGTSLTQAAAKLNQVTLQRDHLAQTLQQTHASTLSQIEPNPEQPNDTTANDTSALATIRSLESSLMEAQTEIQRVRKQRQATEDYANAERQRMTEEHRQQINMLEQALQEIEEQVQQLEQIRQPSRQDSTVLHTQPCENEKLRLEQQHQDTPTQASRFWSFAELRAKRQTTDNNNKTKQECS